MGSLLRRPLIIIGTLLCAALVLCVHEFMLLPDGHLHIYFMDVGQGDGALVVTPSGKQIVIDGGPAGGPELSEIAKHMPLTDHTIDLLVLSHPQLDHIFAFPDILRRYAVGHVLMTGITYKLARYDEFLALLKEKHVPVWIADPSHDIDLGDGVVLDVVWPPPTLLGKEMKDVNNSSIVLRVMYHGSGAAIFTGDMEEKEERAALASGADVRATVLKAGHHGSKTSSGTGFLLAVHPTLVAISCGRNNTFGHPHKVILDRYKTLGIPFRVTAWEGTIEMAW